MEWDSWKPRSAMICLTRRANHLYICAIQSHVLNGLQYTPYRTDVSKLQWNSLWSSKMEFPVRFNICLVCPILAKPWLGDTNAGKRGDNGLKSIRRGSPLGVTNLSQSGISFRKTSKNWTSSFSWLWHYVLLDPTLNYRVVEKAEIPITEY